MNPRPETWVLNAMWVCLAGAAITLACGRNRRLAGWICLATTAASAVLIGLGLASFAAAGPGAPATFLPWPSLGFSLRLHVDGLTALFLGLAAAIALPAALFSLAYLDHYPSVHTGRYYPAFLVFLSAMYGLVSTTDMMWFFFIFWQLMTWPGYALIRFERNRAEHLKAARRYLWMMQVACALTMAGAAIVAGGPVPEEASGLRYDLASVSMRLPQMLREQPALVHLAFTLFLLGFGIKMGMWPFGVLWLPDAHPAAPSPVSAMLSGVMIKTGVYGLVRYFLYLPPPNLQWTWPLAEWGAIITGLGTVTLLLGTWQALRQEQTKRLLAFHSIGQIGYILFGIGCCLWLLDPEAKSAPLAGVALFGALFHTINHGCFKALLFLNAGSLLYRAGTQDLNRLGGLFRAMPLTGATALVAALAISGIPPLNGFASKWSLFAASLLGNTHVPGLALGAVIALFTSVLTLASFVKFFGATFLGAPPAPAGATSSPTPGSRRELPFTMLLPQVFLAGSCLFLGLVPALAWQGMSTLLQSSRAGLAEPLVDALPALGSALGGLVLPGRTALVVPAVVLLVPAAIIALLRWLRSRTPGPYRGTPPWQCGAAPGPAARYTAHHLYHELKRRLP